MQIAFRKKSKLTPLDQWRMYFNTPKASAEQIAERLKKDITYVLTVSPQKRRA